MKPKWIQITESYEINDMAIVTIKINNNELDVTIGLPSWGLQNHTVAYMPLPESIIKDPLIWKSEYRDDELPQKSGSYIVQLSGIEAHNENKLKIIDSYFLVKEDKWLRIPDDWEVIGWMKYPKPYKN